MRASILPCLFIAHSAPTLALDSEAGRDYRKLADSLPVPDAILVFSAHWEAAPLALGETQQHDSLIYDFSGFPDALYDIQYPAPGSPALAAKIYSLLAPQHDVMETQRGLDHGVWVPFLHMWPDANIPILQLSIPHSYSDQNLFKLGQQLRPLRNENILVVTTGVITHNLRTIDPRNDSETPSWALEFDQWVESVLIDHDYEQLLSWQTSAPHANMNHPTPEHFRPLFIAAGAGQQDTVRFPISGFEWASLSRRSITFG